VPLIIQTFCEEEWLNATTQVFCATCGKDVSPAAAQELFCPACSSPLLPRFMDPEHDELKVPAPEIYLG
jgi:DNA-directed RNA polymerase subunit RPC12/RpoP